MFKIIFGISVVIFVLQNVPTNVSVPISVVDECPKFKNVENLNMEKMLGQWYVLRDSELDQALTCYLVSFHKLTESNKFLLKMCLNTWNFECESLTLTISDRISSADGNDIRDPMHSDFHIRETDYDNYAVVQFQKCLDNSFMILSRNKVYDGAQLDKLTKKYIGKEITWVHSSEDCPKNKNTTTNQ